MSKEIRYCEDCAYCVAGVYCHAPQNMTAPLLVRRDDLGTARVVYCLSHRQRNRLYAMIPPVTCGRSGRWWKPKEGK